MLVRKMMKIYTAIKLLGYSRHLSVNDNIRIPLYNRGIDVSGSRMYYLNNEDEPIEILLFNPNITIYKDMDKYTILIEGKKSTIYSIPYRIKDDCNVDELYDIFSKLYDNVCLNINDDDFSELNKLMKPIFVSQLLSIYVKDSDIVVSHKEDLPMGYMEASSSYTLEELYHHEFIRVINKSFI